MRSLSELLRDIDALDEELAEARAAERAERVRRHDVPQRVDPSAVAGWCRLLERVEWEWFCTLTFRPPRSGAVSVHPERAAKCFEYWLRLLVREARRGAGDAGRLPKRGAWMPLNYVCAAENTKRGALHFHALLEGVPGLRRLWGMDAWDRLAGYARIVEPARRGAVANYVAKYVGKGLDLEFGGPWVEAGRLTQGRDRV